MTIEFGKIEDKWQREWAAAGLERSEIDDSRPSFFMIFAYPGVTGYLHVGHMRGYTISDAICRYKRMTGFNVLFPVGTHATGNGALAFARRVERGDDATISTLRENGCSDEEIARLSDPNEVVGFFNNVYLNDYWKRFGFLSDWSRFTCTINPDYQKFIEWQMMKLHQKRLLIQKPYYAPSCPEHGPVAIDASETDLQRGGTAEMMEYSALKFKMGDRILVAATLRPETIFGLTNFWVNPNASYVVAKVSDEKWILSKEGFDKLRFQRDDVAIKEDISPRDMIGETCIAPHTGKDIPILPSELVDPSVGTGLVMSVPSDAPYDWMGLVDLRNHAEKLEGMNITKEFVERIKPIPIIKTPGWGPLPAVEICEKMGIEELSDPKLEDATKEIYKSGFHKGVLTDVAGEFAGRPVEAAKDEIRDMLLDSNEAALIYDLSDEVVCRCGKQVMIRKIPDQWFINYADEELTRLSRDHTRNMTILPREYYDNVPGILEWFRERACVRQGNWLGTRFPLDRKWIVEAIADSTLYPAYYLISKYVNEKRITAEEMKEAFFDLLFRDEGDLQSVAEECGIDRELLRNMKEDIDYWYPLDINLGGKEHMTVHFPVFIMNHVGLLPEKYWPKGIIVNWYIIGGGGKISKSKGGAQPIPGAAARFGVDPMRLFYAHVASLYVDVAWDDAKVENYRTRLLRIEAHVDELLSISVEEKGRIDNWLLSRVNRRIETVRNAMDVYDVRTMANEAYFELPMDLRWYIRRGGGNRDTIGSVVDAWVKMLTPITPHVAEELWKKIGGESLVSSESFPETRDDWKNERAEAEESYLKGIIDDIAEILKVTGISPKKIAITTAPEWKKQIHGMAVDAIRGGIGDIGTIIKKAMEISGSAADRKEIPKFVKSLMQELGKMSKEELAGHASGLDELDILNASREFLESNFRADEIVIQSAEDENLFDPANRKGMARPMRPAIYAE